MLETDVQIPWAAGKHVILKLDQLLPFPGPHFLLHFKWANLCIVRTLGVNVHCVPIFGGHFQNCVRCLHLVECRIKPTLFPGKTAGCSGENSRSLCTYCFVRFAMNILTAFGFIS
jgi:hypothetical protein